MKNIIYFLVFIAFALAGAATYFLFKNGKNRLGTMDVDLIEGTNGSNTNTHVETLQLVTAFQAANRLTIKTLQE